MRDARLAELHCLGTVTGRQARRPGRMANPRAGEGPPTAGRGRVSITRSWTRTWRVSYASTSSDLPPNALPNIRMESKMKGTAGWLFRRILHRRFADDAGARSAWVGCDRCCCGASPRCSPAPTAARPLWSGSASRTSRRSEPGTRVDLLHRLDPVPRHVQPLAQRRYGNLARAGAIAVAQPDRSAILSAAHRYYKNLTLDAPLTIL